ncbi:hypothetical protein ABFS83_09G066600 [Erythranthe nasuta]
MEKLMKMMRSDNGENESKKLPPGFVFQPTDEEIVFQYLARKVFSRRLPAYVIPEIDNVFTFPHPSELPGDSEEGRYFFSNTRTNHRSLIFNRIGRPTRAGYWKIVAGSDKQIGCCSKRIMPIVGVKKTLVFYEGKHPSAARTDWFMDLYCIALSRNAVSNTQHQRRHSQGCLVQIGTWVLCHVHFKKRSGGDNVIGWRRNYDHFITSDDADSDSCASSSSSLDSDSSVFSEVSSSSDGSETNSSPDI